MAFHNLLGKKGEQAAADFLKKKGLQIMETNWKSGDIEVDIIAKEADTIVFVEVKTRTDHGDTHPEDAVDEKRKRRLCTGAQIYLKYNQLDNPWRFDIIAITAGAEGMQLNHIEDAFMPRLRTINKTSFSGNSQPKRTIKTRKIKPAARKSIWQRIKDVFRRSDR